MKIELPPDTKARMFGVVYTPIDIAKSISKLTLSKCTNKPLKILEPSVGDGYFVDALHGFLTSEFNITAIDIDSDVIRGLSTRYDVSYQKKINLLNQDFIEYAISTKDEKFDLIIGNPPFIKKHNYSSNFKNTLDKLSEKTGCQCKDLKNSWAAFVVASEPLLAEDGVLSFIVPYELMTVSYGQAIQKSIFPKFERVDVYIPDQKAFKEIDQDAIIFVAQKTTKEETGIFIQRVECLSNLSSISTYKVNYLTSKNISLDLKAFLLDKETTNLLHRIREKCTRVIDFCESSPGIVTGANDYFILTKEQVEHNKLLSYAKKILKKGSFLPKSPIFTLKDFERLELKEPCFLIDFNKIPHDELSDSALDYIKKGEDKEISLGFKCRNRKNWYEVPVLKETEGFFFKRSHTFPKLCINEAGVLVTDTAYQIKLKENVSISALCYSFYNSLTLLFSEIDGRFYGGGVLELTPSEFKSLPLVYKEPSKEEFQRFIDIYHQEGDIAENLQDFGDDWLRTALELTSEQMLVIKSALKVVRQHRLRHGQ